MKTSYSFMLGDSALIEGAQYVCIKSISPKAFIEGAVYIATMAVGELGLRTEQGGVIHSGCSQFAKVL